MLEKIKSFLVKTSLYHFLLFIRSTFQYHYVRIFKRVERVNTVYCISPYKTGTTYFSALFDCKAEHEPLMHATITHMGDMDFLAKRASFLNLDLECSGFFADKLSVLRRLAPNAKLVFLSRHPEAWIGSVVNYFSKLDGQVSYNYVARLVFDPICG